MDKYLSTYKNKYIRERERKEVKRSGHKPYSFIVHQMSLTWFPHAWNPENGKYNAYAPYFPGILWGSNKLTQSLNS